MKRRFAFIILSVILVAPMGAQITSPARARITARQVAACDVIGKLGVPLGDCVEIKATIVGGDVKSKDDSGRFFLKVTHIEGKAFQPPVVCDFFVHQFATETVKLANDAFGLYELKAGKKARALNREQIAKFQNDYLNTPVKLTVYETGGFRGIPNHLPKNVAVWQDVGFGFSTQLCVIDQR